MKIIYKPNLRVEITQKGAESYTWRVALDGVEEDSARKVTTRQACEDQVANTLVALEINELSRITLLEVLDLHGQVCLAKNEKCSTKVGCILTSGREIYYTGYNLIISIRELILGRFHAEVTYNDVSVGKYTGDSRLNAEKAVSELLSTLFKIEREYEVLEYLLQLDSQQKRAKRLKQHTTLSVYVVP